MMFYAIGAGRRIRIGGTSQARHLFGGDGEFACYQGKRRLKCLRHVMTLMANDPLVTTDRDVVAFEAFRRRIPIFYDPEYASDVQYFVSEDDMVIRVLSRAKAALGVTFPLLKVPSAQWGERPVLLEAIPYELARTLGWVSLAQAHNLLLSEEDKSMAAECQYPFHQWGGFFEILSPDDWKPHRCLNPDCANSGGSLSLFGALFNELVDDHRLVDAAQKPFQLLIEMCGMCASVRTSLRCSLGEVEETPVE